jgi:hypothetical protein
MSIQEIAQDLVALCKAGKFDEASAKYHADDILSVEAMGPPGMDLESRGKKAVQAKGEWWVANHEVHGIEVEGPFVNGSQFAVRFTIDVTHKPSGQKLHLSEVALYTVRGDKIAEERFFFAA